MNKELTAISPEGLEIASAYLLFGNIKAVCTELNVAEETVVEVINRREVKKYIDTMYADTGYRNRNNIASLLDTMIESKIEEAQESQQYTNRDLFELLSFAHKVRIDEMKHLENIAKTSIRNQTNVQINDTAGIFGVGNYAALMDKLVNGPNK